MATITASVTKVGDGGVYDVYLATWTAIGNADTGTSVAMSSAADRSVQIEGTFGGATITVQGSNDGTNWQTLTDPQGNAISTTAAKLEQIEELTRYVRVISSGGTGTNVNVNMVFRGQK